MGARCTFYDMESDGVFEEQGHATRYAIREVAKKILVDSRLCVYKIGAIAASTSRRLSQAFKDMAAQPW
jgi:hypothetical protein